jgi:hypothetical protein
MPGPDAPRPRSPGGCRGFPHLPSSLRASVWCDMPPPFQAALSLEPGSLRAQRLRLAAGSYDIPGLHIPFLTEAEEAAMLAPPGDLQPPPQEDDGLSQDSQDSDGEEAAERGGGTSVPSPGEGSAPAWSAASFRALRYDGSQEAWALPPQRGAPAAQAWVQATPGYTHIWTCLTVLGAGHPWIYPYMDMSHSPGCRPPLDIPIYGHVSQSWVQATPA